MSCAQLETLQSEVSYNQQEQKLTDDECNEILRFCEYNVTVVDQPVSGRAPGLEDGVALSPAPRVRVDVESPVASGATLLECLKRGEFMLNTHLIDTSGKTVTLETDQNGKGKKQLVGDICATPHFTDEGMFCTLPNLICVKPGLFRISLGFVFMDPQVTGSSKIHPAVARTTTDVFRVLGAKGAKL